MPDSATTAPGQVSLSVAWHCGPLGQFEVITRQLITTFLPFDTGRLLINLSALNGGGQCYTMLYKYLKYSLSIIEVHTRL